MRQGKLQLPKMSAPVAAVALLGVTVLWGSSFASAAGVLACGVSPGLFNLMRGVVFAALIFACFHRRILRMGRAELRTGLIAGALNFGGFLFQSISLGLTTPANSAFITTVYVVFVPFLAWICYRRRVLPRYVLATVGCTVGMAVLTGMFAQHLTLNVGDAFALLCALFYAGSIAFLSYGAAATDFAIVSFLLAATQAVGGLFYFLLVEGAPLAGIGWAGAIGPIIYLGAFCSFLAQSVQVYSQRFIAATPAALIMMLESVFGSIFSVLWGYEPASTELVVGGGIIVVTLALTQPDWPALYARLRARRAPVAQQPVAEEGAGQAEG